MTATVLDHRFRIQGLARDQNDDRNGPLAPPIIRQADHRDLADLRQLVDHALNLRGRNVFAAGNDHVLLAIDEIEKAFAIHTANIAGPEPVAKKAARDGDRLAAVARAIRSSYQVAVNTHVADLGKTEDQWRLGAIRGDIDILINNAGSNPPGEIDEIDDDLWRASWRALMIAP
jgi:NAD(P)-dependent dehydrogenase (short-subunit alcohol dehydrogenase family)